MANFIAKINPFTGQLQLVNDDGILFFKASVATVGDLPASGNTKNDARIVNDTHNLYVWDGSSWIDQGDVMNVDWSAITNKPSSAVADIDDAVSKKHTQNTDIYLDTQVTKLLYVDGNRTDSYTENGSITKPFKTITAALNATTPAQYPGWRININPGTYTENLTIPENVDLFGASGFWKVNIIGNISTGINVTLDELTVNGDITFKGLTLRRIACTGQLILPVDAGVVGTENSYFAANGKSGAVINGGELRLFSSQANCASGDFPGVQLNVGNLVLVNSLISNSSATVEALQVNSSCTGAVGFSNSYAVNSGGGNAMVLNNINSAYTPNSFGNVAFVGNVVIAAGTHVFFGDIILALGTISGGTRYYRPSSFLTNDSSVSGTTVKDALETLDSSKQTVDADFNIKTYKQTTEPTLSVDETMAIWIDTDDSYRTYLIFRRGVLASGISEQVKVELT